MAQRVEAPTVTVAAGVLQSAPAITDLIWPDGKVREIEVVVPPGPSGLVGFAIGHSGQVIIPRTVNQWVVTDDEKLNWDIEDYPSGGKWFVRAYNTDAFDHTLYFRFHLDELGSGAPFVVAPLEIIQPAMRQVVIE